MIRYVRTDAAHADYKQLVAALDADLAVRDGEDHAFYAAYNKSDSIKHVILAYENDIAVGCGAVKHYEPGTMEVKRMYVPPAMRQKSIASGILGQLENWCRELGYERCILETGKMQPEAIALYGKNGYSIIPNYGQYAGVENSLCFEKWLRFK